MCISTSEVLLPICLEEGRWDMGMELLKEVSTAVIEVGQWDVWKEMEEP